MLDDNLIFKQQSRVRLTHDPLRIGYLTGREQMRGERKMLQVQFADETSWKPENQLETVGDARLSPLDMLERKNLARPIDLRRALIHVKITGRLADVIYSMEATNTDFYAYQFKPVIKILESPSNAILIADEVGLGKTIEAGLIWTELRSRFDMRRLLVLCPAALREKWQRELSTKIGVPAQICNTEDVFRIMSDDSSHARGFALIASIQGLRPPKGWEEDQNRTAAKLAHFLKESENDKKLLDLLIIDEAHHLRNPETQNNELGQLFRNISDYTALLTATPIHNRNEDLYALLKLLDPDTFTRTDVFNQILQANSPLVKARDLVLSRECERQELMKLLHEAHSHPLLKSNRQLSNIEESELVCERELKKRESRSKLAYRLETVNLLAHVVTRTRKRDVKELRVVREPIAEFVKLKPIEEKYYKLVTETVLKYAQKVKYSERFLLAQPQRLMTSSMPASLKSWQKKLVVLEESKESGDENEDYAKTSTLGPLILTIASKSKNFVDLNDLIKADSKYERLKIILSHFFTNSPQEKVVLFSTFHATLDYLAERLTIDGVSSIQLKGGQKETKDDVINHFKKPDGPSVLLSSEVGGEGVDLQFSWVVINYDLPWNPMRLEQRIGRIDRLGQNSDKVLVWNMLYENTIDSRIYKRLYDKLGLCKTALGDFEAILGDEIRKLEIDLLSGNLSIEQQEKRIDQTAQALENLRIEENKLEQEASGLVAYGDYILNHVQASKELYRWISSEDIKHYVFDYLRLNYQGCNFRQLDILNPIYEIDLSAKAKLDLKEYMKKHKIFFDTRLVSEYSRTVRYKFENKVTGPQNRIEESISQFHPLIRMISSQIIENGEQLTPAVAIKLKRSYLGSEFQGGLYILGVTHWSFRALQDVEKLAYSATLYEDPSVLLTANDAEKLASVSISYGEDWLEAENIIDLEKVYDIVNNVLFNNLDEEYYIFLGELTAKNEDRADVQLKSLEQHFDRQKLILEETRKKLVTQRRDQLVKATEGRKRALQSRVEQQRLKIESGRKIFSETKEIAIALINVI